MFIHVALQVRFI